MNDLKDEITREYREIAGRWRLRTAAAYVSILAVLLLLAHFTDTRKEEVASLQKRWQSSALDRDH